MQPNNQLLGCFVPNHKCIDNAIHTFAGIELRMECARMTEYMEMPEKTGVARMTYGYNLPGKTCNSHGWTYYLMRR